DVLQLVGRSGFYAAGYISVTLRRRDDHQMLGSVLFFDFREDGHFLLAVRAPVRPEKHQDRRSLERAERNRLRSQKLALIQSRRELSFQAQQIDVLLQPGANGRVSVK